jgi:hypothetical protein
MKKYLYKLSLILVALVVIPGCKKEYPIMFDSSTAVVGFSSSTLNVKEVGPAGTVKIYLGGSLGQAATDVVLSVSVEGISLPAVEGTDFTISSKNVSVGVGETVVTITPIDNNIFTGDKQFKLIISSNSKSYPISAQNTVTVTIADDEHPLKSWIGTYKVAAASYGDPGAWDESWTVVTSPVAGDVTKLSLKGVGSSSSTAIIATLNIPTMTITLKPGQSLGDPYGAGPTSVFKGTPDLTFLENDNITGTIQANGTIHIDLWGEKIVSGVYAGPWDVFNTTWTKQ